MKSINKILFPLKERNFFPHIYLKEIIQPNKFLKDSYEPITSFNWAAIYRFFYSFFNKIKFPSIIRA
jgi:hypothetical protein